MSLYMKLSLGLCLALSAVTAEASILENQVAVIYNAASADGTALKDAYLAAHPGIPAANVCALNDTSLVGLSTLSYADFITKIRNPIRAWFNQSSTPDPDEIISIVLMRPFPHRVQDTDNPNIGDNPPGQGAEFFGDGDATSCSVDAELALLWQDLENGQSNSSENGARLDSYSDNAIANPYHQSTSPIDSFNRNRITNSKNFAKLSDGQNDVAWGNVGNITGLREGDIYLVCRLDGQTQNDALSLISRALNARVARPFTQVILDEYNLSTGQDFDDEGFFVTGRDDYEETRDDLLANGWNVLYDDSFSFIASSALPLVAYASYGENHSQSGLGEAPPAGDAYIEEFEFVPGAIFNTIESYNARALNGLGTIFDQEQIADFIRVGGTYAVGCVWEPFSPFLPDNEYLMTRMMVDGWTFAEAAYASLPALSWQAVAIGDPLGCVDILGDIDGDRDVLQSDALSLIECINGVDQTLLPNCELAELDFDQDVDTADAWLFQQLLGR